MGERQQKKSDSRRQHKHLRVRTPPWKKVKAVCSLEQLRGAHCGTVKQTNKRGNRLQTTVQSSGVKAHRLSMISFRKSKIGNSLQLETLSLFFSLPSCKY